MLLHGLAVMLKQENNLYYRWSFRSLLRQLVAPREPQATIGAPRSSKEPIGSH